MHISSLGKAKLRGLPFCLFDGIVSAEGFVFSRGAGFRPGKEPTAFPSEQGFFYKNYTIVCEKLQENFIFRPKGTLAGVPPGPDKARERRESS